MSYKPSTGHIPVIRGPEGTITSNQNPEKRALGYNPEIVKPTQTKLINFNGHQSNTTGRVTESYTVTETKGQPVYRPANQTGRIHEDYIPSQRKVVEYSQQPTHYTGRIHEDYIPAQNRVVSVNDSRYSTTGVTGQSYVSSQGQSYVSSQGQVVRTNNPTTYATGYIPQIKTNNVVYSPNPESRILQDGTVIRTANVVYDDTGRPITTQTANSSTVYTQQSTTYSTGNTLITPAQETQQTQKTEEVVDPRSYFLNRWDTTNYGATESMTQETSQPKALNALAHQIRTVGTRQTVGTIGTTTPITAASETYVQEPARNTISANTQQPTRILNALSNQIKTVGTKQIGTTVAPTTAYPSSNTTVITQPSTVIQNQPVQQTTTIVNPPTQTTIQQGQPTTTVITQPVSGTTVTQPTNSVVTQPVATTSTTVTQPTNTTIVTNHPHLAPQSQTVVTNSGQRVVNSIRQGDHVSYVNAPVTNNYNQYVGQRFAQVSVPQQQGGLNDKILGYANQVGKPNANTATVRRN